MREIKFRAWSNKYRKIFRVSEISVDRDGYTHGLVDAGFENEHRPNDEEFKSPLAFIGRVDFIKSPIGKVSGLFQNPMNELFYLMQYTGLKDKNGKEIYEGDIIKAKPYFVDEETLFEVVYADLAFRVKTNEYTRFWGELHKSEIAGNRFENPELLEVNAS